METPQDSELIGRASELSALRAAVDRALAGHGSLWLLSGEPGIGKSALARALSSHAEQRGARVLWGRCWETGGAPVYWPFIQLVRGILAEADVAELRDDLGELGGDVAQLVPELRTRLPDLHELPSLAPVEGRFRLFDALCRLLTASARRRPLLIVLDDLHAADRSSLELLDFLARSLDAAPIAIVGAYREADARIAGMSEPLSRLHRSGHVLALAPLSPSQTGELLRRLHGRAQGPERLARTLALSEGNPLFVEELARRSDLGADTLPDSLLALLGERLSGLPPATVETLRAAAVLGREPGLPMLAALCDLDPQQTGQVLSPAFEAGVLQATGGGGVRFSHVLVREALYRSLAADRRFALHLAAAELLQRASGDDVGSLSELAHHLCEAGSGAVTRAIDACMRAGEVAARLLAFDEAVVHYERALELQSEHVRDDRRLRCELMLRAGRARILAGSSEAGRAACLTAAGLARELADAPLLARAALELGAAFRFASVDDELCGLLQEALDALGGLGAQHAGLRALVLARLSAALQPALDPRGPMEMAHRAIELAREHGDPDVMLGTLRSGLSALMDLEDPRRRAELNREHVELARRLGQQAEVLRGCARLCFDYAEMGDMFSMDATIDAHGRAAAATRHPFYEWQHTGLRAMADILRGNFERAQQLNDAAWTLSQRTADPLTARYSRFQAAGLARARYDDSTLRALIDGGELMRGVHPVPGRLVLASLHAQLEQPDQVRGLLDASELPDFSKSLDVHVLTCLAEAAFLCECPRWVRDVDASLRVLRERNASWGLVAMICDAPMTRTLALVHAVRGERDLAEQSFAEALARAQALWARPSVARIHYDWGIALRRFFGGGAQADAQLARARAVAEELGMQGLLHRIDALGVAAATIGPASPDSQVTAPPRLQRDGEGWGLFHGQRVLRMRHSKGLSILARLLDEPGREHHVIELSGDSPGVDTGDSGELLDRTASDAYRARLGELQQELQEAREWNDAGRVERLEEELSVLTRELSRALGLSGQARVAGSAAERARVNVQKRIRHALAQIARQDAQLARELDLCVRTGVFCCYEPRA